MLIIVSGCAGTKHLKEGEYILYKQSVEPPKGIAKEDMSRKLVDKANRRLLFLPISIYTWMYYSGLNNYNVEKYEGKKEKINNKFSDKIAKAESKPKKASRLEQKQINKVAKVDRTLQEGNQFMRWGEPVSVLDSANLELSRIIWNGMFIPKDGSMVKYFMR